MPSNKSGYGSIPPPPPSIDEEKPESHELEPQSQGDGAHHDREIQVERASRFLFMLTILAVTAFGAFTTGDFVSDKGTNLTMSSST
eukprot:CAMPEP_0113651820 /NCGR_PEP_ID=MMETSP0017_2-20120614/27641_1 /TAXON_ID=2856 /ORGANISM="Cylindrotheca closterium" /LENGTH=85 /DNA_ID=CAMNT_0000564555 /DNA_START=107 /DNA_END=360 /DNA_ORIENTATION=+ /assembly_acc=CAM_ASM_000147